MRHCNAPPGVTHKSFIADRDKGKVATVVTKRKAGRPKAQYSQAARMFRMFDLLQQRQYVTIPLLMEHFEVNRRTIQRDLNVLLNIVLIEEDGRTQENEKRFRLTGARRTDALRVTTGEMLALYMGRNLFAFTDGTELKRSIDSLFDKLSTRLAARRDGVQASLPRRFYCTVGSPRSYVAADGALDDVVEGLLNQQRLAITYKRPGKNAYGDVIEPYTLVVHNHALFVVARSKHAGATRVFAVERIAESDITDERFEVPDDYDPAAYFAGAFGIAAVEKRERVVLRFRSDVAPYVRARQWHPTLKLRDIEEGMLEVEMEVGVGEELLHWICGYGKGATVVEPPSLREAVRARLE